MDQYKIQERKQLIGKVMNAAMSLVLLILGWVTVTGTEFSDIQTFLYRWRDTKWDLICSSWGVTYWHSFFLGKKLWVIYVNVIKDTFLLLSQLWPCIQLKEL